MAPDEQPRLAVVSDVAPERSQSGQLLLYRLLTGHEPDRLLVVEGCCPSLPDRRLPGVAYEQLNYAWRRLLFTRFARAYNCWLTHAVHARIPGLVHRLRRFRPDAVLTVADGFLWLAAAGAAKRLNVPCFIVFHDDWFTTTPLPRFRLATARLYGQAVRRAAAALCVSPFFAEELRAAYGIRTRTLFPSRGDDSPAPRVRVRQDRRPFTAAFAGSLPLDYEAQLGNLATALAGMGGRLLVFTNRDFSKHLTGRANVVHGGFVPAGELADRLDGSADVLFLPMSYLPVARHSMSMAFPSKLADYTAIGLPILISGPEYSSAVRWAAGQPGVAKVVNSSEPAVLAAALAELADDYALSLRLAETAAEVGNRLFTLEAVREEFYRTVSASVPTPAAGAVLSQPVTSLAE